MNKDKELNIMEKRSAFLLSAAEFLTYRIFECNKLLVYAYVPKFSKLVTEQ